MEILSQILHCGKETGKRMPRLWYNIKCAGAFIFPERTLWLEFFEASRYKFVKAVNVVRDR